MVPLDWVLEEPFTAVEPVVIFGQLLQLLVQFFCLLVFDLQSSSLETTSYIQCFKTKAGKATKLKIPPGFGGIILCHKLTVLHFKL